MKEIAKSPAFQFYPNDFLGSSKVGIMTAEETGIYIRLLCLDWQDGGFEFSPKILARWCHVSEPKFKRAWELVGRCFVEHDGRFRNERLDREREKQQAWREKSAKGGSTKRQPKAKGGSTTRGTKRQPNTNTPFPSPTPSPTPELPPPTTCAEIGQADSAPAVLEVPCVGPDGGRYGVTAAQIAEWSSAYPGVEVTAELRRAGVWLEANPRKRKTRAGMARFLVAWLSRAQDAVGGRSAPSTPLRPTGRTPEHERAVACYDAYVEFGLTGPHTREEYGEIAARMVAAGFYPSAEAAMAEWRITRPSTLGLMANDDALRVRTIRERLTGATGAAA